MKKSILILFFGYGAVVVYQLLQWFTCKQINEPAHFSEASFLFHIGEVIHNDSDLAVLLVRAIHNKITILIPDILHAYIRFWDFNFLIHFLTFIGFIGIMLGFWQIWEQKRNKLILIIGAIILSLPFIEVFFYESFPYLLRMLLLWIVFQLFSIFGLWMFLRKNGGKGIVFTAIMLFISIIWLSVFNTQLFTYCVK